MFAYCGNDPVDRTDPRGAIWGWFVLETFFVLYCLNDVKQNAYEESLGESDLSPSSYSDGSHEKLTIQEKMDFTKEQTGDDHYSINTWRFYSEYTLHEVGWSISGWSYNKDIPVFSWIADKCVSADVDSKEWDDRWYVNVLTVIIGIFGL